MGKSKLTRKQRSETWKDVVHTKGSNSRSRSSKSSTRSYNDTWRSASTGEYNKDMYYTFGDLKKIDRHRGYNEKILAAGSKVEIILKDPLKNPILSGTNLPGREYPITGTFTSFLGDDKNPYFTLRIENTDDAHLYFTNRHLFKVIKPFVYNTKK